MIESIHQRPILISRREGGIFSQKRSQGEHSKTKIGGNLIGTIDTQFGEIPMSSDLAVRQLTLGLGISWLRSPLKDSALSYGLNEKRREIERESPYRLVSAALLTSA